MKCFFVPGSNRVAVIKDVFTSLRQSVAADPLMASRLLPPKDINDIEVIGLRDSWLCRPSFVHR